MGASSLLRASLVQHLERREDPGIAEQLALLAGDQPLRASGLRSCGRRQTYLAKGTQRSTPAFENLIQMVQGDWGEVGMKKLIINSGWTIRDEQRELSYHEGGVEVLRGHIDGIVYFDSGLLPSEHFLWENKLMSAFRYRKLSQAGSIGVETPEYYDQVQIYMGLLRAAGEDISKTMFTAVAKDPSAVNTGFGSKGKPRLDPLFIEEVDFDQKRFDGLLYRASDIHSVIRQEGLYPRERVPGKDWDCSARFCPFFATCDPEAHVIKTARRKAA